MVDFLISITLVMAVLGGWIVVQKLARDFAARHPEFGPAREEGGSCGESCLCSNGQCIKRQQNQPKSSNHQYFED